MMYRFSERPAHLEALTPAPVNPPDGSPRTHPPRSRPLPTRGRSGSSREAGRATLANGGTNARHRRALAPQCLRKDHVAAVRSSRLSLPPARSVRPVRRTHRADRRGPRRFAPHIPMTSPRMISAGSHHRKSWFPRTPSQSRLRDSLEVWHASILDPRPSPLTHALVCACGALTTTFGC